MNKKIKSQEKNILTVIKKNICTKIALWILFKNYDQQLQST